MSAQIVIRCLKPGGDSLAYGLIPFAQNDELDLLDESTDERLRFLDWESALIACNDPNHEIGQRIIAGDWAFSILVPPPFNSGLSRGEQ